MPVAGVLGGWIGWLGYTAFRGVGGAIGSNQTEPLQKERIRFYEWEAVGLPPAPLHTARY